MILRYTLTTTGDHVFLDRSSLDTAAFVWVGDSQILAVDFPRKIRVPLHDPGPDRESIILAMIDCWEQTYPDLDAVLIQVGNGDLLGLVIKRVPPVEAEPIPAQPVLREV